MRQYARTLHNADLIREMSSISRTFERLSWYLREEAPKCHHTTPTPSATEMHANLTEHAHQHCTHTSAFLAVWLCTCVRFDTGLGHLVTRHPCVWSWHTWILLMCLIHGRQISSHPRNLNNNCLPPIVHDPGLQQAPRALLVVIEAAKQARPTSRPTTHEAADAAGHSQPPPCPDSI
jgi:hypothetical protein